MKKKVRSDANLSFVLIVRHRLFKILCVIYIVEFP